jgi:hypothetical protein
MSSFSKHILSGSVNGRPIELSTAGVVIHTAGAGTGTIDEIFAWAYNNSGSAHILTLKHGATTSNSEWKESIPGQSGLYVAVPGLPLNNALACVGYATGSVKVVGFVNRVAT